VIEYTRIIWFETTKWFFWLAEVPRKLTKDFSQQNQFNPKKSDLKLWQYVCVVRDINMKRKHDDKIKRNEFQFDD
jgi:hypothetical protein